MTPSRSDLVGLEASSPKSNPGRSDLHVNKLLCIAGPTASGKTNLAVQLSQLFPSILVSADSRQVYRGMDIVTGKDHPNSVQIIGIDIVDPDEDCSVAVWHKVVMPSIKQAWQDNQLPIIVGGTGLYIKSLTHGIGTMNIPPNPKLRQELKSLSVSDLQSKLSNLDNSKLTSLNKSDIQNPRRLVRAIEVATQNPIPDRKGILDPGSSISPPKSLIIGLQHPNSSQYKNRVKSRVKKRLDLGAVQETKDLLTKYSPDLPSFTSLGYSYIINFLDGQITREQLIDNWTQSELSYAKRQLTWFNKILNIHWFGPLNSSTGSLVATLAKDWYSNQ